MSPSLRIAAAAALLLLPGLGAVDLWAPDEPRYAQVAEELRSMRHGARGLVVLHLNGEVYAHKPPLYFWLAALSGWPAGRVTEVAARLPSALSGIAAAVLVARFGARLLGARSGWLGAALLLTCWEFSWRARRAQLDVLLALFEGLAFAAFWRAAGAPRPDGARPPAAALALLHASLGLAVLAKGPVGFAVPVLGMAAFLAWERRLSELPRLAPPWALLLSLGPGLAWLAAATAVAGGGFLEEAVGTHVLRRFFAGSAHPRPVTYYLYQLPLSFLPWTLLAPLALAAARRVVFAPGGDPQRARAWRLLLAWLGSAFAFFSLSAGKRGLYLLPALPAAALLAADGVLAWLGRRGARPGRGLAGAVAAVALLELAAFTAVLPLLDAEKSPRALARAAARLTAPGEPVGLLAKDSLVGGLAYYGGRPVAVLRSPREAAAFLGAGGRAAVVPAGRLEALERLTPVEVRARARSGARALLVVSPPGETGDLP